MREEADDQAEDFGAFASPSAEEYARLDQWLGDDIDSAPPPTLSDLESGPPRMGGPNTVNGHVDRGTRSALIPNATPTAAANAGFEDDFGPDPSGDASSIPLDPTPLLLHLQEVRAELAEVEDQDERRLRAGREVARLMQSLGMGGDFGDFDDLEAEMAELGI